MLYIIRIFIGSMATFYTRLLNWLKVPTTARSLIVISLVFAVSLKLDSLLNKSSMDVETRRVLQILANRRGYVKLAYTDPADYKGLILDEWPPGKNRYLGNYIQGIIYILGAKILVILNFA